MADLFELINGRRSIRKYDQTRRPEKEKLLACAEAGRMAPSACNSQPWRFTIVNDPEESLKVAQCVQGLGINGFAENIPAFIIVSEQKAVLIERIGSVIRSQHFAQIDVGIAVSHILLAAQAQGLSTCVLGMINEKKIEELLTIPAANVRVVIAVGYSADDKIRTAVRKPIEEVIEYIG